MQALRLPHLPLSKPPFSPRTPSGSITSPAMVKPENVSESTQWAGSPFNKKTADVILRSYDNIHFRAHKVVLADASPIFEDMFANARPSTDAMLTTGDEFLEGLPLISMEENNRALKLILSFYYAPYTADESLKAPMDDILDAIRASSKYELEHGYSQAKKLFARVLDEQGDALRVYALACMRGMQEEMQLAAMASLREDLPLEDVDEFIHISGLQVWKLIQYRQRCAGACRKIGNEAEYPWITREIVLQASVKSIHSGSVVIRFGPKRRSKDISKLLKRYLDEVCAIVSVRPHGSIVFEPKLRDLLRWAVYGPGSTMVRIQNLEDAYKQLNGGDLKGEIVKFEDEFAAAVYAAISEFTIKLD